MIVDVMLLQTLFSVEPAISIDVAIAGRMSKEFDPGRIVTGPGEAPRFRGAKECDELPSMRRNDKRQSVCAQPVFAPLLPKRPLHNSISL